MMRIAVTGNEGQLARCLNDIGPRTGVEIVLCGRPALDLAVPDTLLPALAAARPDVIISAAAYTAVDQAESDRQTAFAINAAGAGAVARAAASLGVPLIHISTDYVYDGLKDGWYEESDRTNPLSVYGESKLEGERRVAGETADFAIFRTAWVHSPHGRNFLKTMLRIGESATSVRVVADQWGCPTSAADLASACIAAARQLAENADPALRGIFHVVGSGDGSWADFAELIFAEAGRHGRHPVNVNRIESRDYPLPARRPANARLSCRKLGETYAIEMPDWRVSAARVISDLLQSNGRDLP